jgi:hypothetical protein
MANGYYVWVRRQAGDYKKAKYHFGSLENPHWDTVSGGIQINMPQAYIFGYVMCNEIIEGELAHSGIHGPCPHRIKVCVVKSDNSPDVINKLIEIAGGQPKRYTSKRKHNCITDIMDILGKQNAPMSRKKLLEELEYRGHRESTMVSAIKKSARILREQDPNNRRSWIYSLIDHNEN